MVRRSRIDIIADMLHSIQNKGGEIKPTHLMYRSNLSHSQMKTYLDDLIDRDFVEKKDKNRNEYLVITDKGHKCLQKLSEMQEFAKTFGL